MNDQQRVELDAWFAEADDVLDNWRPGLDAMHAPASREPNAEPLPRGDSYYDQPDHGGWLAGIGDMWHYTPTPPLPPVSADPPRVEVCRDDGWELVGATVNVSDAVVRFDVHERVPAGSWIRMWFGGSSVNLVLTHPMNPAPRLDVQ